MKTFHFLTTVLAVAPSLLLSQANPSRPFMADSTSDQIIAHFLAAKHDHPSWLGRILRQDGATQPAEKLDDIARRLSRIAIAVPKVERDMGRTTLAGDAVLVLSIAGMKGARGTRYPRALDLLIDIHTHGQNRGVRSLAMLQLLGVGGHERAVAYLKSVAALADETAEDAITALIVDVHGDMNGSTPEEKAASNAALRELYDSRLVRTYHASLNLEAWAQSQGWSPAPHVEQRSPTCDSLLAVMRQSVDGPALRAASRRIGSCPPTREIAIAAANAFWRLKAASDTATLFLLSPIATWVDDAEPLSTLILVVQDRSASEGARITAIRALAVLLRPGRVIRYEDLLGGIAPNGLPRAQCSSGMIAGKTREPVVPDSVLRRIREVSRAIVADSLESPDVRSAAACM